MRNMSFMLTTPQMYAGTKSVTRRVGWWNLKPGDVVMAVEKGMGLKLGEKIVKIYPILILETNPETLNYMLRNIEYGKKEVVMEGFPLMSPREFVGMFCASHKGCTPETTVNRIRFRRYVA